MRVSFQMVVDGVVKYKSDAIIDGSPEDKNELHLAKEDIKAFIKSVNLENFVRVSIPKATKAKKVEK